MHTPDLFSLDGQVALVTGAAGMYGRQLVDGMCESGATTVVASRDLEALKALAAEHAERGHDVVPMQYDQGDDASILALRDAILERFGHCDILVNNAVYRLLGEDGGFTCSAEAYNKSMQINASGLFLITRAFGDAMAERESGAIVNIGSIHGMIAPDEWLYEGSDVSGWYPDYFFHKGGMINFTRFMASYYGRFGVRCNCVSPGGYQTEAHNEQFLENYARKTQLGRMANDDDLKGAVVFLASAAAAYITGANLPIDAGYTAK